MEWSRRHSFFSASKIQRLKGDLATTSSTKCWTGLVERVYGLFNTLEDVKYSRLVPRTTLRDFLLSRTKEWQNP